MKMFILSCFIVVLCTSLFSINQPGKSDAILETYWKLVEVIGTPVKVDSTFIEEPHIILKKAENKFIGNGSCNNFSGTYKLENPNRISFLQAARTNMACPQLEIESQFIKVLESADSYTVKGDELVLTGARMASQARFKAVKMK